MGVHCASVRLMFGGSVLDFDKQRFTLTKEARARLRPSVTFSFFRYYVQMVFLFLEGPSLVNADGVLVRAFCFD
jgi:hypothetical protein